MIFRNVGEVYLCAAVILIATGAYLVTEKVLEAYNKGRKHNGTAR